MTNHQVSDHPDPLKDISAARRDRGVSLVELLATITILGIVAAAVMTALSTSISASTRQREMATAVAWLQSSTAVLEIMGKQTCTDDIAPIIVAYEEQLRDEAINNGNWDSSLLTVEHVQFWNGVGFDAECSGEVQMLTLRVTSPSGRVTQSLDVVVDDPYAELERASTLGADPLSTCAVANVVLADKKAGTAPFLLKKPSTTKPSEVKEHPITATLTTSGLCMGKLEIRYQWPHNCHQSDPTKCHYHERKVKMKIEKGTQNVYIGKFGKKDKWLINHTADVVVVEHRKKSKRWTPIIGGEIVGALSFR